jgi:acetyl esterase/lipase
MGWGVVGQLVAALAAVSAQVVPGDHYPPRHTDFPGGVTGFPDLVYQSLPGFRPLHLDLYRPAGPDKTLHPFVVYVHGGGWLNGHTRQSGAFTSWPDVLASLAARGYVVASVEYRLSGEARFPAAEQDVKAAIRWLRSQASTYHIDKTRGLIWGASAGGQLAALTATSCGAAALEPPAAPAYSGEPPGPPPGTTPAAPPESDCVQAAVTWYGIFDFSTLASQRDPGSTALRDSPDSADSKYLGCQVSKCAPGVVSAASPVTYIDRNDPPMLLIHGRADKTVPVQQSQEMYDRLHAAGVPVQLFVVPDADHSFIGKTPAETEKSSRDALARVADFIDTTIGVRGNK